ncbi:MAG: hypothetical protein ABIP74_02245 [Candidatus Saccharimonas sp.]
MDTPGYKENPAQRVLRLEWAPVYDKHPHLNTLLVLAMAAEFLLAMAGSATGIVVAKLVGGVGLVVAAVMYNVLNYARTEARRYDNFVKSNALSRYRQDMERQKLSLPIDAAIPENEYYLALTAVVNEAYLRGEMTALHSLAAESLELANSSEDAFHQELQRAKLARNYK